MRILPRVRNRFEVDQFEYLKASADTALLRLAGRWPEGESVPDEPVLVVLGPLRPARLEPVPPPPGVNGGIWRAAYSAPLGLVTRPSLRFQIEATDGRRWALPAPAEHGASRAQRTDSRAVAALRDELSRAAGERLRLMERLESIEGERAELDRELAEVRAAAIDMHRSQQRLRDELERAQDELERLRPAAASREVVVQKADQRLARLRGRIEDEMATRIKAEDAAREEAERYERAVAQARDELQHERERADALDAQLGAIRGEVRGLRAEAARREQAIERGRAGIDAFDRTIVDLEHDTALLRESVGQMIEVASQRSQRRFSRDAQTVSAMRLELERSAAELAQLEGQAEAARDAIRARLAEARMVEPA